MLTVGQERLPLSEINGDIKIKAVSFTANGKYIVGGGGGQVEVWRVEDGERMATMAVGDVRCLAVSKDDRWIAAGTGWGKVFAWDAETFKKVFSHREDLSVITSVDFSPDSDSTRLVTASRNDTATVWDVATRKKVLSLDHDHWVFAAKYSPQGHQIATATAFSVRVWDSNDGRLLIDIPITVNLWVNTGILWSNNHLFVVSGSTIKQLEVSTGSAVSEWPVRNPIFTAVDQCIARSRHGKFIAYSAKGAVMFWDTSTHVHLGLIQLHPQSIRSIALSPDDRFLAISANNKTIAIKDLWDVLPASYSTVSTVYC